LTHIQANVGYKDQNKIMVISLMTKLKGQIYFQNLAQLKNLLPLMQLKLKKETIAINISPIKFSLWQLRVFECLHKQVDIFLYDCANAIWNLKGPKGPLLFVLVTILHQRILITL
jgi:hypothetical protein